LKTVPSDRIESLAEPKHLPKEFQFSRPDSTSVSEKAKNAVPTNRILELSKHK
jgi:hypothetical protein